MKIIHLSDTHVGHGDNAARLKYVIEDIHSLVGDSHDYMVVHTGDLLDRGVASESLAALDLLNALSRPNSSSNVLPVLLCPGNHDYGSSTHIDRERADRFRSTFSDYIFGGRPRQFPVLTTLRNCSFIGLDSSQAELGFWTQWFAEGQVGEEQMQRLAEILDKPEVQNSYKVVYLHHHPFIGSYALRPDKRARNHWLKLLYWYGRRFMRLKDAYSLMQCVRDRIDLLLFGHRHYGLDHRFEATRYGLALALDASSTTCTGMDIDLMRYRIIDTTTGQVHCRFVTIP